MSEELKIETTISRDYKPTYDELTEEWIVPLNDKTCATIYGLSATKATANKLYEAWHKYNKAEPDYKAMCEEMAECLEYFSRLESYSDVGGIFQIKTDNIIYAKNILTKYNAMKGE